MGASREALRDGRLEELNRKVDEAARRSDAGFDAVEAHLDRRFEAIEERLYALQRLMTQLWGLVVVAAIVLIVTQL